MVTLSAYNIQSQRDLDGVYELTIVTENHNLNANDEDVTSSMSRILSLDLSNIIVLNIILPSWYNNSINIPCLPNLKELRCSNCIITTIPELPMLEKLYLSGCHSLVEISAKLSNLKELSLINCSIAIIPALPKLEKVSFSNCPIYLIPKLPNLEELNCSDCANLTVISVDLPNLKRLNYQRCYNITSIPNLPNLEKLTFRGTYINIPELSNLTYLNCSYSKLSSLPQLPSLTNLECSGCTELTTLPIMPRLTAINYYGCTNLKTHTIPLGLQNINYLSINTIIAAVEYNSENMKYLRKLIKPQSTLLNKSSTLYSEIQELVLSSMLVKSAAFY